MCFLLNDCRLVRRGFFRRAPCAAGFAFVLHKERYTDFARRFNAARCQLRSLHRARLATSFRPAVVLDDWSWTMFCVNCVCSNLCLRYFLRCCTTKLFDVGHPIVVRCVSVRSRCWEKGIREIFYRQRRKILRRPVPVETLHRVHLEFQFVCVYAVLCDDGTNNIKCMNNHVFQFQNMRHGGWISVYTGLCNLCVFETARFLALFELAFLFLRLLSLYEIKRRKNRKLVGVGKIQPDHAVQFAFAVRAFMLVTAALGQITL